MFCAMSIDELNKATRLNVEERTNKLFFMTANFKVKDSFIKSPGNIEVSLTIKAVRSNINSPNLHKELIFNANCQRERIDFTGVEMI